MTPSTDPTKIREVVFRELTEDQKKWAQHFGFHAWFSERRTPQEAYDCASSVIESFPKEIRMYALVALHVVVNTLAVQRAARIDTIFSAVIIEDIV